MMKHLFKLIFLSLVLFSALPAIAMEQTATTSDVGVSNFCSRIDMESQVLIEMITARETNLTEQYTEREQKLAARFQEQESELLVRRGEWDSDRMEQYVKLEARASSTQEKAAVKLFEHTVDAAVAKRRSAVEQAVHDYQHAVLVLTQKEKDAIRSAAEEFKVSVNIAAMKVKSDCTSSTKKRTARTSFVSTLKNARVTLQTKVKTAVPKNDAVTILAAMREKLVAQAVDEFKQEIEHAKAELLQVFPNSGAQN